MRYSYEFKVKCVELYERGKYPDTPNGITTRKFRDTIRKWKRMVDSLGVDVLCKCQSKYVKKIQNKNVQLFKTVHSYFIIFIWRLYTSLLVTYVIIDSKYL